MRWPGQLGSGSVVTEPISAIDILPTLAGLFGVSVPGGYTIDGLDLWPLLSGDVTSLSRPAIFGFNEAPFSAARLGAVRDGDWKLIEFYESDETELYNLAEDPTESKNVADQYPQVRDRLKAKLARWQTEMGAKMPVEVSTARP